MVLLSLLLQTILIICGPLRKTSARVWIRILVWSAYLSADMVATVALGNLARSQGDSSGDRSKKANNSIQAIWAPFLLLHLGGPDTITAYSIEDNELWLRHLLGLVVQVGVAFYVFSRSWGSSILPFIAIPMFIAGIIKYSERTWRGDGVQGLLNNFKWCTTEVEFSRSIVVWHLATEICSRNEKDASNASRSKCLSEYMMYLLVIRPNMLSKGFFYDEYLKTLIRDMRYKDIIQSYREAPGYDDAEFQREWKTDKYSMVKGGRVLAKQLSECTILDLKRYVPIFFHYLFVFT
ncbi:hypothetical protein OIU84_007323 [Salix udensis]|uniref:DUF4220 domain-containing protein n=1 Tax=Salix udensis TaxID=889485 RepID=A0AAD6JSL8_9ROSI|nr:hypothetical protein OIU84_007323 [Salix udensis]